MIQVRTLGTAEVVSGRQHITPDSAMLFALALFLGVNAGQRVPRSRLLGLFWPDARDDTRRHALRQLLYRLRRDGFPLLMNGAELFLDNDVVQSDVRRVLAASWPDEATPDEVRAAGDLLPGYEPPMSALYREWLDELRSRVQAQYRRALLRHIDAGRRDGRWDQVDEWARRCLEVDPLNEEATLARAESAAMAGAKVEALQIIDRYLDELGDRNRVIGLPAKVLRRRVSESMHEPRVGDPESVPLIGREAEVARLNDTLTGTLSGHAATLFIVGAAGIGKSRIAQELRTIAGLRGWRSCATQLQASDAQRPLGVFVDLFSALLQLPGALGCSPASLSQLRLLTAHDVGTDAEAQRSQEAEAVQERLRRAADDLLASVVSEGPLVLVIDDLHWCDDASIRLLQHVVPHSMALPVMWAFTARPEGKYESVREALADVRGETMRLAPLNPECANTLFGVLAARAQVAAPEVSPELTCAVTGGNPFFVLELARHLGETGNATSLPPSLRTLIRDRAMRLSPIARHVLHTCAVLGRYASVPRVAGVLEIGTADLLACIGELDALGIVGADDDMQELSIHDLWRDELLDGLLPAARKLIHHRCGVVLEAECRMTRSPAIVWEAARHLLSSGAEGRALGLLEERAQHQLDNGLAADSARTFEMAAHASTNDADRFRAMDRAITALRRTANWDEIARVVGVAIELSSRSPFVSTPHSDLELLQTEVRWLTETDPLTSLDSALRCVGDETATASHRIYAALLATRVAANLARLNELTGVLKLVDRLPRQDVDDRLRALSASVIYHTEAGDLDVAIRSARELVSAERERGSIRGLARALRFESYPLRCLGEYESAMLALREALDIAEHHRLIGDAATASDSIVNTYLEMEDIPAAQAWVGRAKSWSALIHTSYARTGISINDAMIAVATGNNEAVESLIDLRLATHANDPIARQRMLKLSVLVRYFSSKNDQGLLRAACEALGEALRRSGSIGRVDYAAASHAIGLNALGESSAAVDAVHHYLTYVRRDRSRPSPQLTTLVGLG